MDKNLTAVFGKNIIKSDGIKVMVKIIDKNSIKIGKEPVVILPLKEWKKIEEMLEDLEDAVRFNEAISDPKNQGGVPFEKAKKMLKLP
ncbi:MAG: hypothetical protein KY054_02345 [Candidatus Nealsonbacteria bacterium]|nr:hypothetical protein [Candidatus Nealsonbacteria bacterium]